MSKKACKDFNTPQGCRFGTKCKFDHVQTKPSLLRELHTKQDRQKRVKPVGTTLTVLGEGKEGPRTSMAAHEICRYSPLLMWEEVAPD